jgi:hypothetical protein
MRRLTAQFVKLTFIPEKLTFQMHAGAYLILMVTYKLLRKEWTVLIFLQIQID